MDGNRQTRQKGENMILQSEMEIKTEKTLHGRNEKDITKKVGHQGKWKWEKTKKWNTSESRNQKDGENKHENRNGKTKTDCDIWNKKRFSTKNICWNQFYLQEPDEFEISKISKSSAVPNRNDFQKYSDWREIQKY
jgi:hypothetical protein